MFCSQSSPGRGGEGGTTGRLAGPGPARRGPRPSRSAGTAGAPGALLAPCHGRKLASSPAAHQPYPFPGRLETTLHREKRWEKPMALHPSCLWKVTLAAHLLFDPFSLHTFLGIIFFPFLKKFKSKRLGGGGRGWLQAAGWSAWLQPVYVGKPQAFLGRCLLWFLLQARHNGNYSGIGQHDLALTSPKTIYASFAQSLGVMFFKGSLLCQQNR